MPIPAAHEVPMTTEDPADVRLMSLRELAEMSRGVLHGLEMCEAIHAAGRNLDDDCDDPDSYPGEG